MKLLFSTYIIQRSAIWLHLNLQKKLFVPAPKVQRRSDTHTDKESGGTRGLLSSQIHSWKAASRWIKLSGGKWTAFGRCIYSRRFPVDSLPSPRSVVATPGAFQFLPPARPSFNLTRLLFSLPPESAGVQHARGYRAAFSLASKLVVGLFCAALHSRRFVRIRSPVGPVELCAVGKALLFYRKPAIVE